MSGTSDPDLGEIEKLRAGGKPALARALTRIETEAGTEALAEFLDQACAAARAQVVGLTGPPGVGKSTLTNALIRMARAQGRTVGVIAVDPSSARTGGALLGDRTRLVTDPEDQGIFVRSMAARDRLGGLSDEAIAAVVIMRAVMDLVIVETVGIGQSEADIAQVADTVVLAIQPGSGDSLQFMKAGVMEMPDIFVVTKADMGPVARRARADVEGALGLSERVGDGAAPAVVLVSSVSGEGLDTLVGAVEAHRKSEAGRLGARRQAQQRMWIDHVLRDRFGREGMRLVSDEDLSKGVARPFEALCEMTANLRIRMRIFSE